MAMVLFAVVLLGPLVAKAARLPAIIGLIAGGALVGPNGLDWLERAGTVELLGGAGLLFLMFQAGVELDLDDFAANRANAMRFGAATFAIPMALGTVVHLAIGYEAAAAVLLASCWASHTLLAYPIFQRLGQVGNRAVSTAVSATIITDIAALLTLVIVVRADAGGLDASFLATLLPKVIGAFVVILVVLPRVAAWFFRQAGRDRLARFVFVAAALYGSATLAEAAGVEPIIGAFLAGLALNRLVPHGGLLAERIDFFGESFLVPLFLVSVGMLVDVGDAIGDPETIGRAGAFAAVVVVSKLAAAALSGRVMGLSGAEVLSMFSLSVAQAAATLAAVFVGLEAGIVDEATVNAVIAVIALTCILSSVAAARAGTQLEAPPIKDLTLGQRVLVGVVDGTPPEPVVQIAAALAAPESGQVMPVEVLDLESTAADVAERRTELAADLEAMVLATGAEVATAIRLDLTPNAGLLHAAVEQQATCLVLGWRGHTRRRDAILGEQLDVLVALSPVPVLLHRDGASSGVRRVVVAVTGDDLTPAGRRTLTATLLIAERLASSNRVPWMVVSPSEGPVREVLGERDDLPEIIIEMRRPAVALAERVSPSDLLVVGIPRALDGLGVTTTRIARAVPACRLVAVAAR